MTSSPIGRSMRLARALAVTALLAACSLGGLDAAAADAKPAAPLWEHGPARKPPRGSPLGMNLAPVRDWSTQRPFADLFKQSRAWISNSESAWDDGRPLDLDARGWPRSLRPGQRARSLVMWGEPTPPGTYVVTWSGTGTVDVWPQKQAASSTPGKRRIVVDVDPAQGFAVTIETTDPRDPVRDIHVWPQGLEGQTFHPAFLASLKPFSTLRFMDWMLTNESEVVRWEDRGVVEDARWSTKGVPLEIMIDLANAVGADAWISIPHTWNDDAVARAATIAQVRLKPELALWVEHSNEVWNGMFPQATAAQKAGTAHALSRDPFEAQLRWHARRSVDIFIAFEAAFQKTPTRLVRVMGSMVATPWASNVLLDVPGAAAHTDALAIAPYFGNSLGDPEAAASTRALGADGVFRALDKSVDEALALVAQHKKAADAHKVQLVAYEGGQHLVGVGPAQGDDALSELLTQVNRDPRMKATYARMLAGWKASGAGLFVHYLDVATPSKFGRWGARERIDQPRAQAPKWDALLTFIESTPAWW